MSDKSAVEHFELCFRTVEDNVNMALSIMRAGKFNRDAASEHHRNVVLARLAEVRGYGINWAIASDAKQKDAA